MKHLLFTLLCLVSLNSIAQDKIVMCDSTALLVTIVSTTDKVVTFKYPNEEIINERDKSGIAYIEYASGRKEVINARKEYALIESANDWSKVIVTHDKNDAQGLLKVDDISVRCGNGGVFDSASKAHRNAIVKIKKVAAKKKCCLVLITSENFGGQYNNISSISGVIYQSK